MKVDETVDTERATSERDTSVTFDPGELADQVVAAFPAERIAVGENPDGSLEVVVTDAGRRAAEAAGIPVDCDMCRVLFQAGDEFHRATLGIDDAPDVVGAPPGAHNLVETRTELVFCRSCVRKAQPILDGALYALWELRKSNPETEDGCGPPTERVV